MINEGVESGSYLEYRYTTLRDLKVSQNVLRPSFKYNEEYEKIRPVANQSVKFFDVAKTYKFNNIEEADVEKLKVTPMRDQTGTFTYNNSNVIGQYFESLCWNEYSIKDTKCFPEKLQDLPP